ncbi:ATP-binding protein [Actinotalea ferrariae]|uniref:ATP-binding protein n=1 Tax=Actinotalea ferrariae TaxID=1386098 RepID=UPI001C8BA24F|nr:ATP-binding protein [Actinotalea ferrariae]MBX9246207.1 ATP-binding protein [Actinotalea ferrariae]
MDPSLNPFSPGSGRRPPELVGRAGELEAFDTLVARTRNGLSDRGIVLTGLRGVGKTVLLNEMHAQADRFEWLTVRLEARRDEAGVAAVRRALAREVVAAARKLTRRSISVRMRQALETISAFNAKIGATGISLGVDLAKGRADSGDAEVDLLELVEDVSLALAEDGRAFGLFIDEMQDLDETTMGALLAAQHLAGQRGWPFYVIGAGLPNLPRVLTEARSYAERLFTYRSIGQLPASEAARALVEPAERLGAGFAPDGLAVILDAAGGYPYFLQEYGQAIWNLAPAKVFTADDAAAAVQFGLEHLDAAFFRSRWERATPAERRFLLAMAHDNDAPSQTSDVARRVGLKITSLGPYRANLMAKGLIYSPEHGQVAYTVPGMAAFVDRHREDLDRA